MPTLRTANVKDYRAVADLLTAAKLPLIGVDPQLNDFVVAESGAAIVACAGLERYGSAALLRSVAVANAFRGTGLGQQITAAILAHARTTNIETVALLTETADAFFPKFGFTLVPRDELPASVRQSDEFRSACPASARAMVLHLTESRR